MLNTNSVVYVPGMYHRMVKAEYRQLLKVYTQKGTYPRSNCIANQIFKCKVWKEATVRVLYRTTTICY